MTEVDLDTILSGGDTDERVRTNKDALRERLSSEEGCGLAIWKNWIVRVIAFVPPMVEGDEHLAVIWVDTLTVKATILHEGAMPEYDLRFRLNMVPKGKSIPRPSLWGSILVVPMGEVEWSVKGKEWLEENAGSPFPVNWRDE